MASCSTNLSSEYLWEQLLGVAASQDVKELLIVFCLRVLLQRQLQENVSRSRNPFSEKTAARTAQQML